MPRVLDGDVGDGVTALVELSIFTGRFLYMYGYILLTNDNGSSGENFSQVRVAKQYAYRLYQ